MNTVTAPSAIKAIKPSAPPAPYWPALLVFGFFLGFLCLWTWLDHTSPCWDGAGHALRGYVCADVLRSPMCLSHKLTKLLTVNSFYPPFAYFVHGLTQCILGSGSNADSLQRFIWYGLAGYSLYRLSLQWLNDRAVAGLAVAIFYLYPTTYGITHAILLLDMPLTAMTFLGLWRLSAWYSRPSWLSSVGLGVALGLAFLTKQTAVMFFAAPLLVLFVMTLIKRQFRQAAMLVVVAAVSGGFFLSWFVPNYAAFKDFVGHNQTLMTHSSLVSLWLHNFRTYMELTLPSMSLLGVLCFVGSLAYWPAQRKLWLLSLSASSAIALHTFLNWIPQFRYVLPATAYAAILSAAALLALWRRSPIGVRAVLSLMAVLALVSFLELNLTAWPIPVSQQFEKATGVSFVRLLYSAQERAEPFGPTPKSDEWGYGWVFDEIGKADGKKHAVLSVLPDLQELNTAGFLYYARMRESSVQPITYRIWSMTGYDFVYKPEELSQVRWFLVLKNSTHPDGREFQTPAAAARYKQLQTTLDEDPSFQKFATKTMPDGSQLIIYKNLKTDSTGSK